MDLITVGIGIVILWFGIFNAMLRRKSPEKLKTLGAMKQKLGDKPAQFLHILAYSIIPIVFGVLLLFSGLNGISLIQLISCT